MTSNKLHHPGLHPDSAKFILPQASEFNEVIVPFCLMPLGASQGPQQLLQLEDLQVQADAAIHC